MAITAVSAVMAVIIPPSILMIVWGGVLTTSIGALFLAGITSTPNVAATPPLIGIAAGLLLGAAGLHVWLVRKRYRSDQMQRRARIEERLRRAR